MNGIEYFALVAIGLFVVSFLLGSIPFGLIISKVFYHTDIREHGSGNIGTTNAIRTMGKVGGYAVFVLDFGKGLLSGVLAGVASSMIVGQEIEANALANPATLLGIAFLACTWGHIFSPWLKFKGGKGIAVAVGCLFMTFGPLGACLELLIFIVLVVATKRVSIGSIASAAAVPFFAAYYFLFATFAPLAWVFCSIAGLTVVWAHRENIKRLRAGTESRIGDKKKDRA
ncbi:MAG: glycerol-3-phosphate 1-O-acyltransferase PlsY [Gordonibacter sp.]